jgi:dTDP-L-rhamnose 4-epimerase
VLAVLGLRCLDGRAPLVNEDGLQRRDFVHVEDVARACVLALESERAPGRVFNVGSGQSHSVREVAERLARALGSDVQPEVTGRYRPGDVRHCFADVSLAKAELGYAPEVTLERGLAEFAAWLSGLRARDRVGLADALHSRPEVFTKALGTVAP